MPGQNAYPFPIGSGLMNPGNQQASAAKPFFLVTVEAQGYWLKPFHVNDHRVNRFLEISWCPQTRETTQKSLNSFYAGDEKQISGIFDSTTSLFIGAATLYRVNRRHGSGVIGLMIGDESYWCKCVSIGVTGMIIDHSIQDLKLRRLTGGSYAVNHGMNFTFKRLVFGCEGHYVKAAVTETGDYMDACKWTILADEWTARAH